VRLKSGGLANGGFANIRKWIAAAHKAKDADAGDDPEFDRVVELGSLVEFQGGMCGPHLMLLHEIAHALDEVHKVEGEREKPHHRHH